MVPRRDARTRAKSKGSPDPAGRLELLPDAARPPAVGAPDVRADAEMAEVVNLIESKRDGDRHLGGECENRGSRVILAR